MFVSVLNAQGKPLMPCQPRKARLLLKAGKAKVVRMVPFTLQLLSGSSGYTQEISLGIDTGTKHIGISACTEKTVLLQAEVLPRSDIVERLSTRRQFGRARRSRKTRYHAARFLNRKKQKGWLAPSVQRRVEAHLKTITLVHRLLPIRSTTTEVAQFDLQKITNPAIEEEQYQQGVQAGFWNVREYILWRDGHQCQRCQGTSNDPILNMHHLESRKTGGDRPDNLITLCKTCHHLIHQTHQEHTLARKSQGLRDATQMGMIRWRIIEQTTALFANVHLTYEYRTKSVRIERGLEKSHLIDARCISESPLAQSDGTSYLLKWVCRNIRQLHKATIRTGGQRPRNTAPKEVHGYHLFDCVRSQGTICFVFGRRSTGYFDLRRLDGTKIHASASHKHLRLVQRASACVIERRAAFLPLLKGRVSCRKNHE